MCSSRLVWGLDNNKKKHEFLGLVGFFLEAIAAASIEETIQFKLWVKPNSISWAINPSA